MFYREKKSATDDMNLMLPSFCLLEKKGSKADVKLNHTNIRDHSRSAATLSEKRNKVNWIDFIKIRKKKYLTSIKFVVLSPFLIGQD